MTTRPANRLLILGWDAADWKVIDPLLASGRLPHLAALIASGLRADLSSLEPRLSPLLWTSVATGKVADQHGILNFLEPDGRGGVRPVASTSRTCKALWNILSQSGLRSNVVSWYATHPAEPIRGVCVSNLFQEGRPEDPAAPWPLPPGSVHPPELAAEVAALRLHPRELYAQELMALLPRLNEVPSTDRRLRLLAKIVAQCSSVHNVATALLARDTAWDCSMVFFEAIDVVGHHFMQYYPPRMAHVAPADAELFSGVVPAMYELQDAMLGVLLKLAGPDTTVVLLSDHGFHSDHLRPAAPPDPDDEHAAMDASWHRKHGVLVMSGPGVRAGAEVYGAKLLDIAPTALTLLGLPVGADMQGRVLAEALEHPGSIQQVFSWDAIEGDAGMHPPDLRVDPFEATDALRQLADLGYVQGLGAGAEADLALVRRETRFNRAVVRMSTGRMGEAASEFAALHAELPDEPRYWMNLAQSLYAQNRLADARNILENARSRGAAVVDADIMLAVILGAEGRPAEAIALLERTEQSHPGRGEIPLMLGRAYAAAGRAADAERCFRAALDRDPCEPRAHVGLAQAALARADFENAAAHCLEAARLQHFFPEAHYTLGVALTWLKNYEFAIKAFEVAISMEPGMLDAHRYLASIYRHLGRAVDAGRHRQTAERLTADRGAGRASLEQAARQTPLGPQQWASAMGADDPAGAWPIRDGPA